MLLIQCKEGIQSELWLDYWKRCLQVSRELKLKWCWQCFSDIPTCATFVERNTICIIMCVYYNVIMYYNTFNCVFTLYNTPINTISMYKQSSYYIFPTSLFTYYLSNYNIYTRIHINHSKMCIRDRCIVNGWTLQK